MDYTIIFSVLFTVISFISYVFIQQILANKAQAKINAEIFIEIAEIKKDILLNTASIISQDTETGKILRELKIINRSIQENNAAVFSVGEHLLRAKITTDYTKEMKNLKRKKCIYCGNSFSIFKKIGNTCPDCGARFESETTNDE